MTSRSATPSSPAALSNNFFTHAPSAVVATGKAGLFAAEVIAELAFEAALEAEEAARETL